MKITAGKLKGKLVFSEERTKNIRPTQSKVREAIFNILQNVYPENLRDANIMDLCCGSGILGIEAISRGANFVFFIDKNIESVNILRKNLKNCGVLENSKVLQTNISNLPVANTKFNLVFLDPPYDDKKIVNEVLEELINKEYLANEAVLFIETDFRTDLKFNHEHYSLQDTKHYGKTKISIIKVNF